MACLQVTTAQLQEEFVAVFGGGASVPVKLWVDHYHDYHTFIRVVFTRFNGKGADLLADFRDRLMDRYGFKQAELSVVVFMHDADWAFFAAHRTHIHLAR